MLNLTQLGGFGGGGTLAPMSVVNSGYGTINAAQIATFSGQSFLGSAVFARTVSAVASRDPLPTGESVVSMTFSAVASQEVVSATTDNGSSAYTASIRITTDVISPGVGDVYLSFSEPVTYGAFRGFNLFTTEAWPTISAVRTVPASTSSATLRASAGEVLVVSAVAPYSGGSIAFSGATFSETSSPDLSLRVGRAYLVGPGSMTVTVSGATYCAAAFTAG